MKMKKAKIMLEITENLQLNIRSQGEPESYILMLQLFLFNLVQKLLKQGSQPQNLKKMIFLIMAPVIKELDRLERK